MNNEFCDRCGEPLRGNDVTIRRGDIVPRYVVSATDGFFEADHAELCGCCFDKILRILKGWDDI